jgi:hypothetical protein
MEKNTATTKYEKQAPRPPAPRTPSQNKTSSSQKNHGPTKATGRAEHTPDGTIEQTPEEQAP